MNTYRCVAAPDIGCIGALHILVCRDCRAYIIQNLALAYAFYMEWKEKERENWQFPATIILPLSKVRSIWCSSQQYACCGIPEPSAASAQCHGPIFAGGLLSAWLEVMARRRPVRSAVRKYILWRLLGLAYDKTKRKIVSQVKSKMTRSRSG